MKKFFAVLMLAAALILPGLAQAKDAQTSMIDDVVKRGVLRVGFSSVSYTHLTLPTTSRV